jgi:hypothetical protein
VEKTFSAAVTATVKLPGKVGRGSHTGPLRPAPEMTRKEGLLYDKGFI